MKSTNDKITKMARSSNSVNLLTPAGVVEEIDSTTLAPGDVYEVPLAPGDVIPADSILLGRQTGHK